MFFYHGKSNAKGVAVLFRNNLNIKIKSINTDNFRSFIILQCFLKLDTLTLVNIYAPNTDSPSFFKSNFDTVDSLDDNNSLIICGDYNLVQDPDLDYHNYKSKSQKFFIGYY